MSSPRAPEPADAEPNGADAALAGTGADSTRPESLQRPEGLAAARASRFAPEPGSLRMGYGSAHCHHGELFQGADLDPRTGKQRVILTTLRTSWIGSRATFSPSLEEELRVDPPGKGKSLRAAALALEAVGYAGAGGLLRVESYTVQARGFGASTSDCLSSLRAVLDAFHAELLPAEIARIIYRAEGALDPLMFDRDVVFCSRAGYVREDLGGSLPPVDFLGFDVDPEGNGVVTEDCPHPAYDLDELESFRPMIGALRHAVARQDAALLGRVATASTKLNQRLLPKPHLGEILAAAERAGALGVSVAHTGTLVTLLFNARDEGVPARMTRAEERLAGLGFGPFWRSRQSER